MYTTVEVFIYMRPEHNLCSYISFLHLCVASKMYVAVNMCNKLLSYIFYACVVG